MELHQIRYFLAVDEKLNFTHAADTSALPPKGDIRASTQEKSPAAKTGPGRTAARYPLRPVARRSAMNRWLASGWSGSKSSRMATAVDHVEGWALSSRVPNDPQSAAGAHLDPGG